MKMAAMKKAKEEQYRRELESRDDKMKDMLAVA
jgi:hypothetical protein